MVRHPRGYGYARIVYFPTTQVIGGRTIRVAPQVTPLPAETIVRPTGQNMSAAAVVLAVANINAWWVDVDATLPGGQQVHGMILNRYLVNHHQYEAHGNIVVWSP